MALLSLDRHDVLETIRQSNSLHEAFLQVAKLPAVGEYRTATNADRVRSMTDEELADWLGVYCNGQTAQEVGKPCVSDMGSCEECWLDWLKQEAVDNGACSADETSEKVQEEDDA